MNLSSNYTYHQVYIFIKLFIGQYNKFQGNKIIFYDQNSKNVTEKCINLFAEGTKYFTNGEYAKLLLSANKGKNNKDYISLLSSVYENDLKLEYKSPLIFIMKEKKVYAEVYLSDNFLKEKYKSPEDYLKLFKQILLLENPVEPTKGKKKSLLEIINEDDYVITKDNFKKMIMIFFFFFFNKKIKSIIK